MGEPYPEETGAFSYTHICLENFPYKVEQQASLLYLLRRDILCTDKGGVYLNSFNKHAKSAVENIASHACLGWGMPSMTVRPCLIQDFFVGGNSMTVQEKGGVFSSPLLVVMC